MNGGSRNHFIKFDLSEWRKPFVYWFLMAGAYGSKWSKSQNLTLS